jgi:hypothetical protein
MPIPLPLCGELLLYTADSLRVYRIWGKKSLADADWAQIDAASTAGYSFFKVTVEMK